MMDCVQPFFSDSTSKISNEGLPAMEQVLLDKDIVSVPEDLCENEDIFKEVFSVGTLNEVFNASQLQRLMNLLPTFPENDKEEKEATLCQLFDGENFKFGNPLTRFFWKLKNGFLSPDIADMSKYLKRAIKRHHSHQQHLYFCRLLKSVLSSRKKLLEASVHLAPNDHPKMDHLTARWNGVVEEKTRWRYFSELQEVREEVGDLETSSEDENYPEGPPPKISRKHKKLLQNMEAALGPEMVRIHSTMGNSSFPTHSGSASSSTSRLSLVSFEMTEDKYHNMLQRHQQRRLAQENHPELNVTNIILEDVISRTAIAKRASRDAKKKSKSTDEKKSKHSLSVNIKKEPCTEVQPQSQQLVSQVSTTQTPDEAYLLAANHQVTLSNFGEVDVNLEDVDVDVGSDVELPRTSTPGQVSSQSYYPTCFFSLLRDLFYELPDQKMSVARLEERVKNWLENTSPVLQEWISMQENWVDLVVSALKFLAGDLIAILPENFVPYLDYREKQQQWQWIGAGRDSEEHLTPLCQHWTENKDDVSLDALETSQGSPPPPRVSTDWTVRTTTDEEKKTYREQECIRYQNPHKAFTFHIHGYESVVGPVKGVYGKESGINKAREHSLLVSDRPPFVTILSLVRDSAARLPNGEGTRADICELLKDSQYLAPASDQQIHTVVSGALDRLHYEKDPCVKYDVNRKLWIYLHRHRTEEEFERIHQAQAAAAKAKKAIQKSKPPRTKSKDSVRSAALLDASTYSLESGALTVAIPNSPRSGASSRPQTSPKQGQGASSRALARSLSLPVQNASKSTVATARRENAPEHSTTVASTQTAPSPKQPTTSFPSFLPPSQNGENSRPPSQGSVHSLPSPKAVIANVNAAQFMGVTQLQAAASLDAGLPSPSTTPTPPPLTIDMKPSSPAFVGQPPVLQPVIGGAGTLSSPLVSTPVSKPSSVMGMKRTATQSIHTTAAALQGFQTIVIKQEAKPTTALSSLPLLATGAALGTSTRTTTVGSKPVMARLVSGTQVVSLGNLMASAASVKQGSSLAGAAIRIQGGGYVQPATSLNVLQASHLATGARLPKLAVVTQASTTQAGSATTTQAKLIAVDQSQLSMLQAAHLEGAMRADCTPFATSKSAILSQQGTVKLVASGAPANSQIVSQAQIAAKSTTPVTAVTSTSCAIPSMILSGGTATSTPAVVIATQGALKSSPHTYVMAGPGTAPTVVMATTQHGVRGAAVTPLNMKTLQGIKVIPMTQTMGSGRGSKVQPLLARIIAPPSSITLRPAGPMATISTLGHVHQVAGSSTVGLVQSLRPLSAQQSIGTSKVSPLPLTTSSGQPVIVQVHTPTLSEPEQPREPQ